MKFKNYILFTFIVAISSFVFAACGQKEEKFTNMKSNQIIGDNQNTQVEPTLIPTAVPKTEVASPTAQPTVASTSAKKENTLISIKTKDGEMVLKLYDKVAPNTVANFAKKADSKFYNGLIFHRVIAGFMAQGGDPEGTGMGGGKIVSEINDLPFKTGTIGLARGPIKEQSNDSQFFICYDDTGCAHLTGDYVNFGEVVSGLDVLNKIKQGDKMLEVSVKK